MSNLILVFYLLSWLLSAGLAVVSAAEDAPVGFDEQSNGSVSQAEFEHDRAIFNEQETIADGLGPVYNAQSCGECHQNPVAGGSSQIAELRAGYAEKYAYADPPGGSLIHSRAIAPALQEQVPADTNVRTLRMTTSSLGAGFIEAIADTTLLAIAAQQPRRMRGEVVYVPVVEAKGALRVGRFGWKNQHASLESFAADAYLNEMGITSPLFPNENTANGQSVTMYDSVPDPEDDGGDVAVFARFLRAPKAPARDEELAITPEAPAGEELFTQFGCAICHVPILTTAPVGTVINGGTFVIPSALGDKIIHPYSDFLLHDVGTGDGIVQNGSLSTRNKLRTAPLWGLRTRNRLMHDGLSWTVEDAILRHGGEAKSTVRAFRSARPQEQAALLTFLRAL